MLGFSDTTEFEAPLGEGDMMLRLPRRPRHLDVCEGSILMSGCPAMPLVGARPANEPDDPER